MAKKTLRRKSSFGSVRANHISPPAAADGPTSLNVHISFEEALKLHLALGQALAHLNGYDRSTKAGKATCVNLCLFPKENYLTLTESKLKAKSAPA